MLQQAVMEHDRAKCIFVPVSVRFAGVGSVFRHAAILGIAAVREDGGAIILYIKLLACSFPRQTGFLFHGYRQRSCIRYSTSGSATARVQTQIPRENLHNC